MDIEKARQFLTKKGWDKTNPTVGGVFFEGIAELLAEYEAKVIADQPNVMQRSEQLFCDACGRGQEEGLDYCPCLEGNEWVKKAK